MKAKISMLYDSSKIYIPKFIGSLNTELYTFVKWI